MVSAPFFWAPTAAAALLLVCACSSGQGEARLGEPACREIRLPDAAVARNVVFVLNDTLRRDRLGAYGAQGVATPEFDRFAAESLLFEQAVTPSPWTKPAIASLFTSLQPSQHRVASDPLLRKAMGGSDANKVIEADLLAPGFVTLAEVLNEAGLDAAAFVSNPWMDHRFGFGQGFDVYDDSFADWNLSGERVSRAGLDWMAGRSSDRPFFLYLHYIDTHRPYAPLPTANLPALRARLNADQRPLGGDGPKVAHTIELDDGRLAVDVGFRPTRALIEAAYDRGVEAFDRALGVFLDEFRASDVWEQTVVVVTSDHGEALYRRGFGNHGGYLFDSTAAIPLAIRIPGAQPPAGRIGCLASLVDLMPTLCDTLTVTCPDDLAGWSLVARDPDPETRRYLVTEGVMSRPENRSIRNQRFKLLYEPVAEGQANPYSLYDLEADPDEQFNRLTGPFRSVEGNLAFERMSEELPRTVAPFEPPEAATAPLGPELRRRLEELGYTEE